MLIVVADFEAAYFFIRISIKVFLFSHLGAIQADILKLLRIFFCKYEQESISSNRILYLFTSLLRFKHKANSLLTVELS